MSKTNHPSFSNRHALATTNKARHTSLNEGGGVTKPKEHHIILTEHDALFVIIFIIKLEICSASVTVEYC